MTLVGAALVVVLFVGVVEWVGLPALAGEAWERSRANLELVRDGGLSDAQKEESLRRAAPALFGLIARLLGGGALALALPVGVVWLLDRVGWMSLPDVLELLSRWEVIGALTVVGVGAAAWSAGRKKRGGA